MGPDAAEKDAPLRLIGYEYSVYTWIVRAVLHLKGARYAFRDFDPFTQDQQTQPHPFGRVPVLQHGATTLYETAAICTYLDARLDAPLLTPTDPLRRARMVQVTQVIDSYGYWPMVRQVFAQRVFRPFVGEDVDQDVLNQGLCASRPVLDALEQIAAEGLVLEGEALTLADCHLAPMMGYFTRAPEGAEALRAHASLLRWWDRLSTQDFVCATDPLT